MSLGVGLGVGLTPGRRVTLTGTWLAPAVPVDSTRAGFAADTVIPEFGSSAAPERVDTISTSLNLFESAGTVTGTYTDAQGLTCSVSGTYTPTTGAVSLTGTCGDWDVTVTASFNGSTLSGVDPTGGITVARNTDGAASESRSWTATRGAAVTLGTAYYVDSRDGNDGNAGTSAALPKATIAAVQALLVGGETVRFARGSRWREDFANPTLTLTLEAYGVGPRPVIDGFEAVTAVGWSKTGGLTNVYDRAHTPAVDPATNAMYVVLENGLALVGVANTAACDATAGTFVAPAMSASGPYTIYIHPNGSTDPTSDGKVYELVTRAGLATGGGAINGIYCRGAVSEDGPVRGVAAQWTDVISSWGSVHNFYAQSGSIDACGTFGTAPNQSTGTAFVLNADSPSGETFSQNDCFAITPAAVSTALEAAGNRVAPIIGHTNVGGSWGAVTISQLYTYGMNNSSTIGNATSVVIEDSLFEGLITTNTGSTFVSAAAEVPLTVRRSRFYGHMSSGGHRHVSPGSGSNSTTVEDCILTNILANGGDILGNRLCIVTRCVFDHTTTSAARFAFDDASASSTFLVTKTIFNSNMEYARLNLASLQAGTDYNVFATGTMRNQEAAGTTLRAVSTYLGDQINFDPNSVISAPSYETGTDTGDGRRTYEPTAAWLATLPAGFSGTVGPTQSLPGGSGWVTPATGDAWKTFVDAL